MGDHACVLTMLEDCAEDEPLADIVARARKGALCSLEAALPAAVTGGAAGDDPLHMGLEKNLCNRDFLVIDLPYATMQSREALIEMLRTKEPTVDIRRSRPLGIIAFGLAA